MKILRVKIYLIFVVLVLCANSGCQNKLSENKKIDSLFYYHLKRVQEINHEKSIKFMETLTNIKSKADGDWYGINSATDEDLKLWKNWYVQNRGNLKWKDVKNISK